MGMFEDIKNGLQEAIEFEKGNTTGAKVHIGTFAKLRSFSPSEIREIRIKANMTQRIFAGVIGVSIKTVEAWEGGRSKPDGAARRMLGLIDKNPNFAIDNEILSLQTK